MSDNITIKGFYNLFNYTMTEFLSDTDVVSFGWIFTGLGIFFIFVCFITTWLENKKEIESLQAGTKKLNKDITGLENTNKQLEKTVAALEERNNRLSSEMATNKHLEKTVAALEERNNRLSSEMALLLEKFGTFEEKFEFHEERNNRSLSEMALSLERKMQGMESGTTDLNHKLQSLSVETETLSEEIRTVKCINKS